MSYFKEKLKNAICNNDIEFLENNKNRYSINERFEDEDNETLLLYSISDKESITYKFFLENNADISFVNNENENIFHAIVYSGDIDRLIEILSFYNNININARANDGSTPLLLSLSLENFEMAKVFIHQGADVNIGDINDITPLHLAVQFGDLDLVKLLISNGSNYKKKTLKGNYPLALAVNADKDDIVKYLYSKIYIKEL